MIGPNCPEIITPDECKIGIMPGFVFKKGEVGLISKSDALTYEAANQIVKAGLGISTAIGIGGDPIIGYSYIDLLKLYEKDVKTKAIVMIGEIGGDLEIQAAEFIKKILLNLLSHLLQDRRLPKVKEWDMPVQLLLVTKEQQKKKYTH